MVARTFGMYSLADLGVNAGNYNFATLIAGGTFTAAATAAPTLVTLDDTDSQNDIFNDGAPGNFAATPTQQQLTGNVDGVNFVNAPSNPENEFQVTDSNGNIVGFIYDLHDANSAAFGSLQGYVTTFKLVPGETYTVVRTDTLVQADYETFIACFTRGTLIRTAAGPVPIQDIEVGDLVQTLDNGLQPVRWIGARSVPGTGDLAPVLIRKGALGASRDLCVSPQHRMLISGWRAEMLFGERQVLVPAKQLTDDCAIRRRPSRTVDYVHLLFDRHEIIWAEDCLSESFYLSKLSLSTQDRDQRDELITIFPEMPLNDQPPHVLARMALKSHEAALLSAF